LTAEGVDDARYRGSRSLANEVEIEHALDGTWLETIDEASGLVVEEGVGREGAQRSARSSEAADVVVSRQRRLLAVGAIGCGSGRHDFWRERPTIQGASRKA